MTADQPRVLLVEDEKPIRRFIRASLSDAGYRLVEAETGEQARMVLSSQLPELMILDLGLPDMDGVDLIDEVRSFSPRLPILILSVRDREADKVDALDRGADDYLTKPFGTAELLARLRVALRHRAQPVETEQPPGPFVCGDLKVDRQARRVFVKDTPLHLTPIEYRLLATLVEHAGKVLTHRFLLREVWGPGHADEHQQLRVHMGNLRRKIEADPARPQYLLTEQGVGYRLNND